MNKTKVFLKIVRFVYYRDRGTRWVSFIQSFLNWEKLVIYGGIISIKFPQISFCWIIGVLAIVMFLMEFLKFGLGLLDYKKGLWKKEQEWKQKDVLIAPWNLEVKNTLKSICDKLNIEHKFDDKWDK